MSKTFGPYSSAKRAGNLLFVSGQIGVSPTGETDPGIVGQTQQVIENIQAVLSENDLDLSAIVKTTIYLSDIDDFKTVNEVYSKFFDDFKPARATVEVSSLPKVGDQKLLIEIEAVAVFEDKS